jgi:tetratricopeptide (TPR) repeat protein
MGRAQLALYQDDPKAAIAALQSFFAQGADVDKNPAPWELLGEAQSKDGQYADSQKSYQHAADLAPRDPHYLAEVAAACSTLHKDDDAIAAYQKALAIDPKFSAALAGMGQIYQSQKAYDKSIDAYTRVVAVNPDDFLSIAKLVQLNEALGKTKDRDAARDQIFDLYKAGKITAPAYCRQMMEAKNRDMLVLEYFDFKNSTAVRYAFNILASDGQSIEKRISLGTDEKTTADAREKGTISLKERLFHLDVYVPTGHEIIGTFTKEPSYEETRDLVQKYLAGTLKPLDSSANPSVPAPPAGGAGK